MSESTEPQARSAPAPEELHWGISYLREDIQDLRYQMGEVNKRIDETNKRIDETNLSLGKRIDETNLSLGERIDETNRRIEALHKRIDAYFIWTMTTLVAIASILIAVIKL